MTNIIIGVLTLVMGASASLKLLEIFYVSNFSGSGDETELANNPFHFYIYFIMITISSVGYQNYFSSVVSRFFIIILICISIIFVPSKSSQLVRILSSKSFYASKRYKSSPETPHIVITGFITDIAAINILTELFHNDHDTVLSHAIILSPYQPDSQMDVVIRNPGFQSNLVYIQGNNHFIHI